jgi:hypothetical protein
VRATMMNASFLRASLFTSVVSFGVAAFAMGMGSCPSSSVRRSRGWPRCRSSCDGRP